MGLQRFSSRLHSLYEAFLSDRLKGAETYDRIAGYFQSSLLGLAARELKAVKRVRIVCNTEVNPADVYAVRHPWNPTVLEQRKGRVQRGIIAKRIPFCNLRYDEGVEQRLFDVLTGRIEEITRIFGTIPDFITDHWVKEMLENRAISNSTLVKYLTAEAGSPFILKESYEFLDDEWENTAEVLNSREAMGLFMEGW